jgi:hypothetical protein
MTLKDLEAVLGAVRGVRLGGSTWAPRARCADKEGCAKEVKLRDEFQITTTPRHRDYISCMLPGLVTLQAVLCAAQCSFWHALLQYSTLMHALHLLWPSLRQPGHAQRRCSPAPGAPCSNQRKRRSSSRRSEPSSQKA